MKAFVIACVVFLLLVALLIFTSAWLVRCAESLVAEARGLEELPEEEREGAMDTLCARWERERIFFIVFVHKKELSRLEEALTRARAAAKIKSDSDYQIAVAEVQAELAQLVQQVGVRFEGIV